MSVLIQGMEMPESCSVCKLSTTTELYELVCKLLNCYASDVDRETECPLIDIPPHGRLIDVDELKKKTYPFPCAIGVEHAVTTREINEAPTIIPADKEDQ